MAKDHPDHHDADLILKIYDLRREAVMRQSRDAINKDWWPKNADEAIAPTQMSSPLNAAWRQTTSYWEMVYGLARAGVVNADLLLDSNGEGLFLYARAEPYLAQIRAASSPRAFKNAEWVANHTETGRTLMEMFKARFAKMKAGK